MAWSWQKKASEKPSVEQPVEQKATKAEKKSYVSMIVKAAKKHGVPVDQALKVANAEGGLDRWIRAKGRNKAGQLEPSYGPFQALIGGGDTGFPTGLGNEMLRRGIDPRTDAQAEEYFDVVMETVAKDKGWGQWRGADQFSFGSKGRAHARGGKVPSEAADEMDFSNLDLTASEDELGLGADTSMTGLEDEDPIAKEEQTLGDILSGALGDSWLEVPETDVNGMAAQRKEDILAMMLAGMDKAATGSLPQLPGFPVAGS